MTTLLPGLVSVTFRALAPADILGLAVRAGVQLLEWGGDIHVPPGDVGVAQEVGARTRDAGLRVACYGSYYRVGGAGDGPEFERCLDSALALGAPLIRVWAGGRGSAEADTETRRRVERDARRICALAGAAGLGVACEFHGGTLNDSVDAAILLARKDLPNLYTLWQPLGEGTAEERAQEVRALLPWLAHVHVYHWPGGRHAPLADGEGEWRAALSALAGAGRPVGLLLEFVRDDSPQQFLEDAAALRRWIAAAGNAAGNAAG